MADIQRLQRALRNAHQAGDTEAAQRFARAIREERESRPQMSAQEPQQQAPTPMYGGPGPMTPQQREDRPGLREIGSRLSEIPEGILNNPVMDPIHRGSREMLTGIPMPGAVREAGEERGLLSEGPAENMGQQMLRTAGEATALFGLGGLAMGPLAAKAVPQGLRSLQGMRGVQQAAPSVQASSAITAGNQATTGGRMVQAAKEGAQATPAKTLLGEVTAGAGAGGGQFIGRDYDQAQGDQDDTGEMVGGLLGSLTGTLPGMALGPIRRGVDWSVENLAPFTEQGARPRAAGQTQSRAANPEQAAERIDPNWEGVTPARQTGDAGLMAQEQRVLRENPNLQAEVQEGLARAERTESDSLRSLFGGTRTQNEWEYDVIRRTAAPGAEIESSEYPEDMLNSAFDSFGEAYGAVRGQPVQAENMGASLEQTLNDNSLNVGTNARDRVKGWLNSRLETLQSRSGESNEISSDDLLALRHSVRQDQRRFARGDSAEAEDQAMLLDRVDRQLTDIMEENLPEGLADDLRATDQQYRQYKVVEDAVYRSGDQGLSPARLSDSIRSASRSSGQYARGADGELRSLALAGRPVRELLRDPAIARRAVRNLPEGSEADLRANVAADWMERAKTTNPETGEERFDANRLRSAIRDSAEAARELGMTNDDLIRANDIADRLATIQRSPPSPTASLYEDEPAVALQAMARLIGAQSGQRLARGIGSSLVMSQFLSAQARDALANFTSGGAEQLLTDATTDPDLYRALLVGPTASNQQKQSAASALEDWISRRATRAAPAAGASLTTEDED